MLQRQKKGWHGFLVQHHSPDPPAVTLENLELLVWEERLKVAKADNLFLMCKDYWGTCYYDTRVGHLHPGLTFDFIGEMAQMLKSNKIEFVASYSIGLDTYAVSQRPEWGSRDPKYRIQRAAEGEIPKWHRSCTMTGYMRYVLEQLEEIFEAYEPDGLYLDAFDHPMCYCDDCQRVFREKYGLPIPRRRTELRRYVKQCGDFQSEMVDLRCLKEIRALAKKINPKMWIAVSNSLTFGQRIREAVDCHIVVPESRFWENLIWARRMGSGQAIEAFVAGPTQSQDFAPSSSLATSVAKVVTQGIRPILCSASMKPDGSLDRLEFERAGAIYGQMSKYSKYLSTGKPINAAAILYHELTQTVLPETSQKEKVLDAIQFADRVKIPADVILEEDVTPMRLMSCQLLILPDVACLQRETVKTILSFVKRGGSLLATEQTSLFDEHGVSRNEFLLAEALGCDYCGTNLDFMTNPWGSYLELEESPIWEGLSLFHEPQVPPPYIRLRTTSGTIVATHILPAVAQTETSWVGWGAPPGATLSMEPALVTNVYGKGRCIYAGFNLFQPSIPWLRTAARPFLGWLLPDPVVRLDCRFPSACKANFIRKPGEIVVHVVNDLPQVLGEEFAPLPPGLLRVSKAFTKVSSAEQVYPKPLKLKVKSGPDAYWVATPEIETHAVLKVITVEK